MRWFNRTHNQTKAGAQKLAVSTPMESAGRETKRASGFSLLELERAGLSEEQALQMGLVIDRKRRSALGINVVQLKRLLDT